MRTRQYTPHREGCLAVRNLRNGTWDTPWAYLTYRHYRRKNGAACGKRESGEPWWKVICNDPDCPAWMVIAESDILAAAEQGEPEQ